MKKLMFLTALFAAPFARTYAQEAQLSPLLTSYYNIKDALVSSNAANAAGSAADFVKAAKAADMKAMSPAAHTAYMKLQEQLLSDANNISATKDIARQREYFKTLSDNIYQLAKEVKLSATPVYQEYCPMKKASWLSSASGIKNPYYGAQMLTCGKVTDTIK
ncbi:DUF3347 domain-containing protein [Chitinophaga solisilvae]|uniref:DUF3347 domain-containing protein n=1 Tax=Chitinophaga solisilvae TaxID=1233460 RepID=A0A433WEE3_9BACT|nr:DUF3347 domain-containing protein [Chitinophaga solisilvae]NSL85617.1 DUF3347 domain-containing protein [Chitinophaga solisilvae]